MAHENDYPQLFKVFAKYYKICTIIRLPDLMDHLITCDQDNTPKQSYPCRKWFL